MSNTPRILIYRSGAIGDTIVAIPAIHAIRDAHPGAIFVLMTAVACLFFLRARPGQSHALVIAAVPRPCSS